MLVKWILALGIVTVVVLVILTFLKVLDLVVASFLLAALIGVVGWIINYRSKSTK